MRTEGGDGRVRGRTRRAGGLLATLLLSAVPARGQDLSGRAILADQRFLSDAFSSHALYQLYDLRFQRQVSEPLRFRLFFRGEASDGVSDLGGQRSNLRLRQYQPGGEVLYALPGFQLQGLYDLILADGKTDGRPEDRRKLERSTLNLGIRPEGLPALAAQVERLVTRDDSSALDQTQLVANGTLAHTLFGKLHVGVVDRYEQLDDGGLSFARRSNMTQGFASYDDSFLGGRATLSASTLVSYTRLDERARAGVPVSVAAPVTIAHALASRDDTPLDSRDAPPVETPALLDGNLSAPTAIDLGPTGAPYQNLVADLNRFVALDTFRVVVRDAGGNLVPAGGNVSFNVYTSQDAVAWLPLAGGARTVFLSALSLYEVTFAETTSRYLKVVSFDLAPTEARVTELQAFVHTSFTGSETRRTSILLASGTGSVSVRPFDSLTIGYYGLFNSVRQRPDQRPETATDDSDQIASVSWDATPRLNVLGRYQWRDVTATGGYTQAYRALTADLRYAFLRNLDVTLEGMRTEQDDSGVISTTRAAALRTYMRFLRSLDLALNAGVQRQEYTAGPSVDQTYLTAYSVAQLSTALRLRLEASVQRNRYEGLAATELLPTLDERYAASLSFRPGQQLGVEARVGWVESARISGVLQSYHVEWIPFPLGTLALNARYNEDVEPMTRRRSRQLTLAPRWALNRHATLDLNYTAQTVTGLPRTAIFYATLTVTF